MQPTEFDVKFREDLLACLGKIGTELEKVNKNGIYVSGIDGIEEKLGYISDQVNGVVVELWHAKKPPK